MKPYWKSPSHLIAVSMLTFTHLASLFAFFYVIGIGIAERDAGNVQWEPTQEQVSIVMALFFFFVFALIYFFADLGLFLARKKEEKAKAAGKVDAPISRGERNSEKAVKSEEKAAKGEILLEIPPQKQQIPYKAHLAAFLRAALGMTIALDVLTLGVIVAIVVYHILGNKPYVLALLYVSLGLVVIGFSFLFISPALAKSRIEKGPEWAIRIYDQGVERFLEDGSDSHWMGYEKIDALLEFKTCLAFIYFVNGRKTTLFLLKTPELGEEWVDFLKQKADELA